MNISKHILSGLLGVAIMGLTCLAVASELKRIAILDFELNDLAGITPTPQDELERTASIAPLVRDALSKKGGYEIVSIDSQEQMKANSGFGYLFDHPDEAAKLGHRFGADWVAVGRIHKPSFLFAYLKVHLVNVNSERWVGDYVVEVKGVAKQVTERGAARLAEQIDQTLKQRRAP